MDLVRSYTPRTGKHPTASTMIIAVVIASCFLWRTANADDAKPLPEAQPQAAAAKPIAQVEGFPDWVTSVAISPDGMLIAAGSFEMVRLMTPDGSTIAEWKPRSGFVRALRFSPDGEFLVAGGYKSLTTWTLPPADGDHDEHVPPPQAEPFVGHRGYVDDVAFSSDGLRVASCGEDGTVRLWDRATRNELARNSGDGTPVLSIAFSPDDKFVAAAAGDETRLSRKGNVRLLDGSDLHLVRELPSHESAATSVCFTTDGKYLLSGSVDERVHVVDPQTGEAHGFFGGHSRPVNCLSLTGENRVAISGSGGRFQEKNEVKFWDPEEGTEWASLEPHAGKVNDLAVSADGRLLATASNDKTVALIDISGIVQTAEGRVAK